LQRTATNPETSKVLECGDASPLSMSGGAGFHLFHSWISGEWKESGFAVMESDDASSHSKGRLLKDWRLDVPTVIPEPLPKSRLRVTHFGRPWTTTARLESCESTSVHRTMPWSQPGHAESP